MVKKDTTIKGISIRYENLNVIFENSVIRKI